MPTEIHARDLGRIDYCENLPRCRYSIPTACLDLPARKTAYLVECSSYGVNEIGRWSFLPPLHITAKAHRPCFQAACVLVSIRSSIYCSKNGPLNDCTETVNILHDELRVNVRPRNCQSKRNHVAFVQKVPPAELGYATGKLGAARLMFIFQANLKEAIGKEATGQESTMAHRWLAVRIGLGKCCSPIGLTQLVADTIGIIITAGILMCWSCTRIATTVFWGLRLSLHILCTVVWVHREAYASL